MGRQEHLALHRDHAEKTLLRPDVQEKRKAAQAEWLKTDAAKESIEKASRMSKEPGSRFWDWVSSDEHRELKSKQMTEQWADPDGAMRLSHGDSFREKMSEVMQSRIEAGTAPNTSGSNNPRWRTDANIDHLIETTRSYRCSSKKQLIKWSGYSEALVNRVLSEAGISYREFSDTYMVASKMRDAAYRRPGIRNHRVVAVRPGPVIDTYDLTVDGYHNFAVEQGVVVHNSQEDVRFARTVLRVQREVRNGLHKVGRVHLAARHIDPSSVDFEVAMTVPSSIFELGQMEVRRGRAELAGMMERHVSLYWLLSNIYGLSDEEIQEVKKQKEEEQKAAASMGGGGGFESVETRRRSLMSGARGISDHELFSGNREDEKRAEDIIRKVMEQKDHPLAAKIDETRALMRDIASALPRSRR